MVNVYKEEFENRLKRSVEELSKLRTKVEKCDIDGILMASGEVHRHLIDTRMLWRQARQPLHKELTHDDLDFELRKKLEAAESEFDELIMNFELNCECKLR